MDQTLDGKILEDLKIGQTTVSSLAGRLGKTDNAILARLAIMEKNEQVEKKTITGSCGGLTVWRLTITEKIKLL